MRTQCGSTSITLNRFIFGTWHGALSIEFENVRQTGNKTETGRAPDDHAGN